MLWGVTEVRNQYDLIPKAFFVPGVAITVALLDYITKLAIEKYVHPLKDIDVLPFLRIVNIKNKGAAFGILSGLDNNIFIIISLAAIVFILIYISRTTVKLEIFSLSLILGGAAGNLIDRLRSGQVTDFIDFFIGNWHWPAFNIADSALTIGIILFLLSNVIHMKHQIKKS